MKNLRLILLINLFASLCLSAQTNTFPASGNVGIGTTNPSEKLELEGGSNDTWFKMHVDGSYKTGFKMFGGNIDIWDIYYDDGTNSFNIGENGTDFLTVEHGGNVGIGTTSPTAKLEVAGGAKATQAYFNNALPSGTVFANSTERNAKCKTLSVGEDISGGPLFGFFDFPQSNLDPKARIWFEIEDRDDKARFRITAEQGGKTNLDLYGKDQNPVFSIYDPGDAYTFINFTKPKSYLVIGGINVWPVEHKLTVKDGSSLFEGDIFSTGSVGIGTTSPDSKLTVAGNIHAQEVKVTINAGADFVFNEDYKLPSLNEVERFVKEHKHLPEIASEKEMQDTGLYLADMNIKLLQKIEELTLYTIDQEKKIEAQNDQLKEQEAVNAELKERMAKLEQLITKRNK